MTRPKSFRLPDAIIARLGDEASARRLTASALVAELLDEGLKMRRFPGIEYRDGTTGRRAALSRGPDVWEIISALRYVDGEADERLTGLAEETDVAPDLVRLAIDFYAVYPDEVDADIAANDEAARQLRESIERRERLLRA